MIEPEYRAIGVGAGHECLIFWLGDMLTKVVATDLYGNETWGTVADSTVMENPQAFCSRPIRREAIEFRIMDGTDLSFYADGVFDIAWSASSIEHFGGHVRAADAVREMARVARPGGVVAISTEYLLLPDQSHPECFNRDELNAYVLTASERLELTEPIDWSLPPTDYLIDSIAIPINMYRLRRNVVQNDGENQWTSIVMFFRRR